MGSNQRPSDQKPSTLPLGYGARRVCVLEMTSVDISSEAKQREDREVVFNNLTICESEQSIVYSGTDSRNSDIAAMSDFSDDEDETQVEFRPGHRPEVIVTIQLKRNRVCVIDRSLIRWRQGMVGISWIQTIRNIGPISAAWRDRHLCWMMIACRIANIRMRSKRKWGDPG